jgi:HlyD family secretion protein
LRRWLVRSAALLVVVALAWGLRVWFLRPVPIEVLAAPVARGTVEETITNTSAGTVKAHRRTRLSPEAGGMAVAIPFEEGDRVRRGQTLLQLDASLQNAQLELAQRELEAVDARRKQACVQADRARQERERIARLREERIVSEDVLDQALATAESSQAVCEAAAFEVARSRSAVSLAQVELDKTTVRAPFDGIVAEISIELGEWTSPSPPALPIPPVIDLIDPTSIYVSAPMDEVDAARLLPKQRARVTVDTHRGEEFWGTVVRVAPYVLDLEAQNRTVEIDVELDDTTLAATLKPGTSSDVEVILETRENTIRIPTSALYEGNKVLAIEGDRLVARAIEVGVKNWNFTEVLAGLAAGDSIVTLLDRPEIKPGALVRLQASVGEAARPAGAAAAAP